MKSLLVAVTVLSSTIAMADGFVCTTESGLNVKVYNHTQASEGTRSASVMVISDSTIQSGNKTVARFTDVTGNLSSEGASYTANVDLRFKDSSRKGELLAGTKLGFVDTITLHVDHNYLQPVQAGTMLAGLLQVTKRNGAVVEESANCVRYLKQ